jgi:hypothetical protein
MDTESPDKEIISHKIRLLKQKQNHLLVFCPFDEINEEYNACIYIFHYLRNDAVSAAWVENVCEM